MKKLLPLVISITLGGVSHFAFADDIATIYQQAKQNDPQLLSAAASKDSAFEAINSSRASLLPQVNLNAGYNITRSNRDANENDVLSAGIGLTQQIFSRDSWINLDISEMDARKADAAYAATQQGLILRVSVAYFEVLRAIDNLEFVRAEKAAVGRQLEQTQQRFEVGLSAITDVHDARAQYDAVLASEIVAENELINSYEGLREITGQEHTSLDVLDTTRFSASRPDRNVDALLETAQQQNLALLAARITQDVARERIELAQSSRLPTVSFSAGYDMVDINVKNSSPMNSDSDYNDLKAGINLSMPLYTGGNITSQVKQAQYGYVAASQALEEDYRGVVRDVRAYYNTINASIGSLRAYEQTVISARSALEATEAGFDVGTRTIVDVLDSTRRLFDANRSLSNARYDYILSTLRLKQAVGTLSEQDIVDINAGLVAAK
ncbi:outer membrane channel protein TolC [Thaumasiovibrio subtropicus]|uniref:outer membrane channel protein TolC n=1 Tax=Thaumasiovibrio subtropicus TaxID=1891207 RepID=UPI000B36307A|nr:outer membrane channel protein TolC [Thaumasiovibrio subtropicus]